MKEFSFLNNTSTVIIFDGKSENDFFNRVNLQDIDFE